jgi:tetratricopeptide (TPR) repeat protein
MLIITLLLFILSSPAAQKPSDDFAKIDALNILMKLNDKPANTSLTSTEALDFITFFDSTCEKGVFVPPHIDIDVYLEVLEEIISSDTPIHHIFQKYDDSHLLLSYQEFKFLSLVQAQFRLEEIFLRLPSLEKIKNMIPFILKNKELSESKSQILKNVLLLHENLYSTQEKKRYWQAIERMMDKIDLKASESGNQIVQRSPYGIVVQPGQILGKLKFQMQEETDSDLIKYAAGVITAIATAEGNYKREGRYNIEINHPSIGLLPKIDMDKAVDFFDKAFKTDNNELKIQYYSKSIETNPSFSPAFYNRGIAYYEQKQFEEAIADFNQALKLEPRSALAFFYRGICQMELNDYQRAIESFTLTVSLDPRPSKALLNRGLCYQKMESYEKAIRDYSQSLKIEPNNIGALTNRGFCFQRQKEYPRAIQDYRAVINVDPGNASAYYNMGVIYWTKKDWNAVIEAWEKCLQTNPYHQQVLDNLPTAKVNAEMMKKQKRKYIIDQRAVKKK